MRGVAVKAERQDGARSRGGMPGFIRPCDPTLRRKPPAGPEWLYEIKWDGYRAQLHLRNRAITIYSRSGLNWTAQFGAIAREARHLEARQAILDGEAVVLGANGASDFQALRGELGRPNSHRLTYYAFDLLWLDGRDLRQEPLEERKRQLRQLLEGVSPQLRYVDDLSEKGDVMFAQACKLGLEGVVAKRRESSYGSGASTTWLKSKCSKTETFPIVAFVEKLGAKPRRIASLYVGRQEGDRLLYAGKAATGFTEAVARDIREVLDPHITERSPLTLPVKKPKATWVEPVVLAEIAYGSVTDDGLLREAVFKGLREDLMARVETPANCRSLGRSRSSDREPHVGVPKANILQLLPDAVVPSTEQLQMYWRKVAKRALPYLVRRPLKLVRHSHHTTFYHKGTLPPVADGVHQIKVEKREGGEGTRLWVDDLQGLLGLVQMGVVEVHPWNATIDDIEHPDQLVFDLDPGEDIAWDFVVQTALRLRDLLKKEGLPSWPKVTGGKGLHLMVPITPEMTHDEAHRYSRTIAERLAAEDDRYTVSAAIGKRTGRLFIDYLRNGRGTTAVGTYSPRARARLPIAAPVTWSDVKNGIAPDAFSIDRPFNRGSSERSMQAARK